jgi:hypothetical protein
MSVREKGLRRVVAVTAGIAAASAVGTGAVAAAAWASTHAARSTSAGTSSTSDEPGLSYSDDRPHATSGGS